MAQRESTVITPSGEGLVYATPASLIDLKKHAIRLPLNAARLRSRHSGSYLSRFRGRGMEFDEARPYQPGDEIRNLDWRVTARTGRPHTKLFREERERSVILWVDYRAPMFFATHGRFKSVLASEAAALLAWSACRHGDRLGGLVFSEQGHQEIRPRNGDRAVLSLIRLLAATSALPRQETNRERRREVAANALARARRVARPGSLLFFISDFRNLNSSMEMHLAALSRHCELVLLQIRDQLELELPIRGRYPISDGSRRLIIDSGNGQLRETYQRHQLARAQRLQQLCRRHRMHLLDCNTVDDPLQVLMLGLGGETR